MLLSNKYLWLKVPKTGTMAYKKLFSLYNDSEPEGHYHYSYLDGIKQYGKFPGVAVVRHPLVRFISGLKFIKTKKEQCFAGNCIIHPNKPSGIYCSGHTYNIDFLSSTDACVKFLKKNFQKNCNTGVYRDEFFFKFFNAEKHGFIINFFITQTSLVYHPKVKIFYYENLHEFNTWLENELGYDTSLLEQVNVIKNNNLGVNFDDEEFIRTVEWLFYDDYKIFGYPFKYLT
jgi:hypothetical protein